MAHAFESANPTVQAALTCWCRLMPSNRLCDLCSSATMAEPMGRPLMWWRMMLRSTAGLFAKRSITCDGTSIKSMGPRVPTAGPNVTSSMAPTWQTPSRHCRSVKVRKNSRDGLRHVPAEHQLEKWNDPAVPQGLPLHDSMSRCTHPQDAGTLSWTGGSAGHAQTHEKGCGPGQGSSGRCQRGQSCTPKQRQTAGMSHPAIGVRIAM